MISVKCTYSNGDVIKTCINGTLQDVKNYFLGQWFNFGDTDMKPQDDMQQCIKVELIGDKMGEKLSYNHWLETMGFVTDQEYKNRMLEDGFSLRHIEKRLEEIHELYEEYLNV